MLMYEIFETCPFFYTRLSTAYTVELLKISNPLLNSVLNEQGSEEDKPRERTNRVVKKLMRFQWGLFGRKTSTRNL
jgi:hypothetical protein